MNIEFPHRQRPKKKEKRNAIFPIQYFIYFILISSELRKSMFYSKSNTAQCIQLQFEMALNHTLVEFKRVTEFIFGEYIKG